MNKRKLFLAIITFMLLVVLPIIAFSAPNTPSSDVYPRVFGTTRTDVVLNAVITSVGTRECRFIIDGGAWTIANNVTFPSTVEVKVMPGSSFAIASGKIVTFNGGFEAGRYTCFSGAGTTAGSPKTIYTMTEWGSSTSYPMGDGAVIDMLASNHTVSGTWLITNSASSFGGVLGANIPDLTAAETVSGAWVHSANLTLDDGTGDSPGFILKDADDKTLTITKLDTGNTTWTSTEGDFLFTPNGDDILMDSGLTVGSATAAGDNNLRVEGTSTLVGAITATGGLLGNVGDGTGTVAINSSDWDVTATGIASGLGTIGCDGDITLTAATGDATISSVGATGEDGLLLLDADAGAGSADSWWLKSEADDNLLYFLNHTTTAMTLSSVGNLTIVGDVDIDGNDLISAGDLTITPGGDDVLVDGGFNVGGTTQPGDNNLRVEGTSALVGAVTASAAVTFVDLTVTNNPSFNSRYALYSKDATTQYATEHGTCTNLQVITFTTAYAVAPQVFLTHQATATNYDYATSISVNGFTAHGDDDVSIAWFTIGQK